MRLTTVLLGVTRALAAVKARCSAPPPLRGADGLDAGSAHARPGSCLTMTNSPTPESEATSRPEITVRSRHRKRSRSGIHDNGCCTTSKRREGDGIRSGIHDNGCCTTCDAKGNGMQLKSILNRVQKHPSFVYETVRLVEHPQLSIEVRVRPRAGTRATCSQCRRRAPGYDTQAVRRFDFVPLWHIPVVFLYAMRRVSCPRCGVRVEALPWATGKHRLTDAYAWFLAGWAKRLSWQEVAAAFPTSWDTVYRAVRMAVDWGLAHHDLTNIEAIGVDELLNVRHGLSSITGSF